jgi:hypothetical protein
MTYVEYNGFRKIRKKLHKKFLKSLHELNLKYAPRNLQISEK